MCWYPLCHLPWVLKAVSLLCADRRMAQRQEMQDAARDEYLLKLFRRADQNCTQQVEPAAAQWQPEGWAVQGSMARGPQQQDSMGGARPSFSLPGYPAHGPLPVHGNPANAGSQEPRKVNAAGSHALQDMMDKSNGPLDSAKVLALSHTTALSAAMHPVQGL